MTRSFVTYVKTARRIIWALILSTFQSAVPKAAAVLDMLHPHRLTEGLIPPTHCKTVDTILRLPSNHSDR
jgi:hypothetical protein